MNKPIGVLAILMTITLMTVTSNPVHAQGTQDDADLAKQAQNPLASLISVPVQDNISFGMGPNDRTQNVANIQPIIPFNLGSVSLITRTIVPVITQPDLASATGSTTGVGDILFTGWLSPAEAGTVVWGLGPVVSIPVGKEGLSTEKWGFGPSFVALMMPGNWVVGGLVNNIWSVGGDESLPDVNLMTLQYFVNYNFEGGLYLTSGPIITANWEATDGNKWTVPFGGGVGKIFRIGSQPMNSNIQAFYNVVSPDDFGADWSLRLQLQAMFPR